MFNIRKVFICFSIMFCVLLLTGCNSKNESKKEKENEIITTQEVVTNEKENNTSSEETTKAEKKTTKKTTTAKETTKSTKKTTTTITVSELTTKQKSTTTTTKSSTGLTTSIVYPTTTNKKYECESGWHLEGNQCYKTYKATIDYKCAKGELAGSGCIINTSVAANATYSCPSGYELDGSTCWKWVAASTYYVTDSDSADVKNMKYSTWMNICSKLNAEKVEGHTCYYKQTTVTNVTYDCNGKTGTLAGNMCISAKVEAAYKFPSCPDGGYLDSNDYCKVYKKAEEVK